MKPKLRIACDTHVHCYQFDQLPELLESAHKNIQRLAPNADAIVLFFTDGFVDRTWLKLLELIEGTATSRNWMFELNADAGFIKATDKVDAKVLYLAPARQVNTAGRLEMLMLGCDEELDDKQPANQLIENYGGRYVLISPWGVGTWLGKRGKVLVDIINHAKKPFALGDNGGRPFFWPVPHFNFFNQIMTRNKESAGGIKKALPIINGSDPLPVSGEISRVGTYGVTFEVSELSLSSVLAELKKTPQEAENFGKPLGLVAFIIARIKMLLR